MYFGSHVLTSLLNRPFFGGQSASGAFITLFPSLPLAQVVWTGGMLAFWIPLATWMNTRRIYLRP